MARNTCRRPGVGLNMRLDLTDDARDLLNRRGGTLAVDLIRPTG